MYVTTERVNNSKIIKNIILKTSRNISNTKISSFLLLFIFLFFSMLFFSTPSVYADGYPPYWSHSNGAVHFTPINRPTDGSWTDYTHQQVSIKDQRDADPSNGGRAPQNYANVSSSCTDQNLPSVYWQYDEC